MKTQSEVLVVSESRWQEAQHFEANLWVRHNKYNSYAGLVKKFIKALTTPKVLLSYLRHADFYCGDDWNYWWQKAFDNYQVLPGVVGRALEVGCGPFSNVRLIASGRSIGEIHCADPLIRSYAKFRLTWLSHAIKRNRVLTSECKCEALNFNNAYFDLAICINVLDHVENAHKCINELLRVTRPGGYIVLGQDLTNEEDLLQPEVREDVGHPIRVTDGTLDEVLTASCKSVLRRVLGRQEGRAPNAHYGTYIYIGQKM